MPEKWGLSSQTRHVGRWGKLPVTPGLGAVVGCEAWGFLVPAPDGEGIINATADMGAGLGYYWRSSRRP